MRISVFCRTKATMVSELDIFPVLYYQNGSVVDVMGSIFCSNTSGSPSVLSPVLAKASHVCLRLNINCIQGFFFALQHLQTISPRLEFTQTQLVLFIEIIKTLDFVQSLIRLLTTRTNRAKIKRGGGFPCIQYTLDVQLLKLY